jgi:hypothetical protein
MSPERSHRAGTTIGPVRAELRSLDSADAPHGLDSFQPDDSERFAIAIGAVIGPPNTAGGDLFYFTACSARWLADNPPEKGFEFMHGYVLLIRWDYDLLQRAIADLCRRTEGGDWTEVATKLSRYGAWEFEGYKEAQ